MMFVILILLSWYPLGMCPGLATLPTDPDFDEYHTVTIAPRKLLQM